jgi:hypothetical protein
MAKASGLAPSTIHRIWREHGLKPHRVETFTLSNDLKFVAKVRDIVGLYVTPPEGATMTHDCKRHGTTTLFAALDVTAGTVISRCMLRHRAAAFIRFLRLIDKQTPSERDLHLILDNDAAHKTEAVTRWRARHRRFHVHFTPTSASRIIPNPMCRNLRPPKAGGRPDGRRATCRAAKRAEARAGD